MTKEGAEQGQCGQFGAVFFLKFWGGSHDVEYPVS